MSLDMVEQEHMMFVGFLERIDVDIFSSLDEPNQTLFRCEELQLLLAKLLMVVIKFFIRKSACHSHLLLVL